MAVCSDVGVVPELPGMAVPLVLALLLLLVYAANLNDADVVWLA